MRAVPACSPDGAPFTEPGVDLRGNDALVVIAAAKPIIAWLDAREPGVVVRSISVRTDGPRVLVSLAPRPHDRRPRVIRFDSPHANELRDAAREAECMIGDACLRVLAARARPSGRISPPTESA